MFLNPAVDLHQCGITNVGQSRYWKYSNSTQPSWWSMSDRIHPLVRVQIFAYSISSLQNIYFVTILFKFVKKQIHKIYSKFAVYCSVVCTRWINNTYFFKCFFFRFGNDEKYNGPGYCELRRTGDRGLQLLKKNFLSSSIM